MTQPAMLTIEAPSIIRLTEDSCDLIQTEKQVEALRKELHDTTARLAERVSAVRRFEASECEAEVKIAKLRAALEKCAPFVESPPRRDLTTASRKAACKALREALESSELVPF